VVDSVRERRGFTLVELLVVIAIIGVLVALLLPAVQSAREASRRMQCQGNMRQLGIAAHNYHDVIGVFPSAGTSSNEFSWMVHILPFIEQKNLYDQFDFNKGLFTSGGPNQVGKNGLALNPIKTYLCSSSPIKRLPQGAPHNINAPELVNGEAPYTAHYYGVQGPKGNGLGGAVYTFTGNTTHGAFSTHGIMQCDGKVRGAQVTDGMSATFLFGEISWTSQVVGTRYRSWVRGCFDSSNASNPTRNVNSSINTYAIGVFNDIAFGSMHPTGCNFCLADASTRFVSQNISLGIYKAAASRDGDESAPLD
jgi:prepilin-type N-terminal cleavage/methylation domain-containing protein